MKFYQKIETIKKEKPDMSYMDGVYCDENDIEIETVINLYQKLKEK